MMELVQKVANRYLRATGAENFKPLVEDALKTHNQLQQWLQRFPQELRKAVGASGQLAPGRVWAKFISDLWKGSGGYDDALNRFRDLKESFGDLALDVDYLRDESYMAQNAIHIPREAQVERVMDTVGHEKEFPPGTGANWALSYDIAAVEHWVKTLATWSNQSEGLLKKAFQSGQRKIKRRVR